MFKHDEIRLPILSSNKIIFLHNKIIKLIKHLVLHATS